VLPLPTSKVEEAAAVMLAAPAEFKAKVPEVVVERVKLPVASVIVRPPVVGPVIVLAVVPVKVALLPKLIVLEPPPMVMFEMVEPPPMLTVLLEESLSETTAPDTVNPPVP